MKIVCVCDYYIKRDIQIKYKELEKLGAEVVLVDNEDLINDEAACMEVMFKTEKEGAKSVKCNGNVVKEAEQADILIVHITPVNQEAIKHMKNLKVLGVMRGGLDSIDIDCLKEKGVKIVHAPSRSAHAVADFTVGMILSETKNIAKSYHGLMEGKWIKSYANNNNVHDLRTRTIGVLGCGNIGKEVIKRLEAFGSRIIVHDPFIPIEDIAKMGYSAVSKEELLEQSDIITIHLRLSEQTKNYIGREEFDRMKPNCIFVNTARAGLVDQQAMLEALKNQKISGAAVDVFAEEPLPSDNPLVKLDNITMTAHIAGASCDTFENSVNLIYDEIERYLKGEDMKCVVV